MTPHNLIEEIGRRLGTALTLDNAGLARIMVDDTLPVDFELDEANERLLVYGVIGLPPPGRTRERFFEELLAANLFGAQTGTCSPAYDRERNEMLLWFSLGENTHIEEAAAALENLVEQALHWRKRLNDTSTDAPPVHADMPATVSLEGFVRA
ncbi:MAG: type III secretion system chaperone [Gammaproteobacteria bacterium]